MNPFFCALRNTLRIPKLLRMSVGVRQLTTSGVSIDHLAPHIQEFIEEQRKLCKPDKIYVCDGSEAETKAVIQQLLEDGRFLKLPKYDNW